nr:gamma carbonic anhydrase family protein [Aestuariispira insulae]
MLPAQILPFEDKSPFLHQTVFLAPGATVIGDVQVGADSSIWYGCVLRGDVNEIRIGRGSNIQDGTVIHVATHGQGSYIGDNVSIGHQALIHACTIEDGAFIGMNATVMDGAVVEKGAMVAAGAMVLPGRVVKSGTLWTGSPAQYRRDLTDKDQQMIDWTAPHYVELARRHLRSLGD